MTDMIQAGNIQVAEELYNFINEEALPGTGVDQDHFWSSLDDLVNELAPKNAALLAK